MTSLYENTPITLTITLVTVLFTALSHSTKPVELDVSRLLSGEFSRLFLSHLIYHSVAESLAGALVLFSFRHFERQMGSRKYGAFAFLCWIVSTLLSLAFSTVGLSIGVNLTPSPGPYFFIFSQLAFYYKYIPKLVPTRYVIFGVELSEKSGVYLIALQLLFSNGIHSIIAALSGILAGYVYDLDGIGFQRFRFPAFIESIFRFVGSMVRILFPPATGAGAQQAPPRLPPSPEPTPIPFGGGNVNPTLRRRESAQTNTNNTNNNNNNNNNNAFFELPPPDEESILTLMNLGFDRDAVVQALRNSGNNLDAAANLLLR